MKENQRNMKKCKALDKEELYNINFINVTENIFLFFKDKFNA